jgi:hypothetical protein
LCGGLIAANSEDEAGVVEKGEEFLIAGKGSELRREQVFGIPAKFLKQPCNLVTLFLAILLISSKLVPVPLPEF